MKTAFDGVQVGTVRGCEDKLGASTLNQLPHPQIHVYCRIIHDDNRPRRQFIVSAQYWDQIVLHPLNKPISINGTMAGVRISRTRRAHHHLTGSIHKPIDVRSRQQRVSEVVVWCEELRDTVVLATRSPRTPTAGGVPILGSLVDKEEPCRVAGLCQLYSKLVAELLVTLGSLLVVHP